MNDYNHKEIEQKWQKEWNDSDLYKVSQDSNDNEYILVEFPYPSGNLHAGHWYAFAVTDIYARYRRMIGKNVLFPIGFDSFGLPAENAAIKRNLNPKDWTYSNIEFMEKQLKNMGTMFDWDKKVITSDPEYYKWTQWLFIQMFNKDLVYKKVGSVNWCPDCKTVLANEQVVSGKCERCDSSVEKKEMPEWKLKITKYADRLIEDLDNLDWPEHIKEAQKNWIGKSSGTHFEFKIKNHDSVIKVFTTRPDTYFGITYLVLAPENKLIEELNDSIENINEIKEYQKKSASRSELERISDSKEKTGVEIKGIRIIHPGTNEEIPLYVSDYVIASYGTGAVMAVPAHDKRDYEFAKKFNLEIKEVVSGGDISKEAFEELGVLINSNEFNKINSKSAGEKITEKFGEKTTNYRIRDWSVSRQRYWGCPIPLINCAKCGSVAVLDQNLPVKLPEIDDYTPNDNGKSPLSKAIEWKKVRCPKCNKEAERETDTLDTFFDSSWYFLRYIDNKNDKEFSSKEAQEKWMPVDFYSGGSEHTTMHLLFARFFQKALYDLGLVENDEPFTKRNNRGLILGPDGNKMSKSKGNVIDPDEIVERLGADTVRAYLAFIGPYGESGSYPWDPNGVVGMRRFIERIIKLESKILDINSDAVTKTLHKTIKEVGEDYQALKFNTAISKLMILANLLEKDSFNKETYLTLIQLFAPVAPHIAEELWRKYKSESIHLSSWPKFDESKIKDTEIKIVVQINGKVRDILLIKNDLEKDNILKLAKELENIKKWVGNFEIKKEIYIEGKLINFVV